MNSLKDFQTAPIGDRLLEIRRQAGMALVVTLALIVLVTIATMAFFARATSNRAIESSRANQVLAAQLSETAQDYVVGRFLGEMTNNAQALTTNGITVSHRSENEGPQFRRAIGFHIRRFGSPGKQWLLFCSRRKWKSG